MLHEPFSWSGLTMRNRIVMPAVNLNFAQQGFINDRIIQFYKRRSLGGAGLIVVGGAVIDYPSSLIGMISIHDDSMVAGLGKLARTIKDNGSLAGIQLFHPGRYSYAYHFGQEIIAPSAIPSRMTGQTPREMTTEEVYEYVELFANAACRAREAGYDMAEVIMSAGYLVAEFLSPLTNIRSDEFGGSLENRMRFSLMIADRIKEKAGQDFPLGIRLGANDFIPGGNTHREILALARQLQEHGVDIFNVTGGWHEAPVPQLPAVVPRGGYAYLAAMVKHEVTVPVVASNRINDPLIAEQILKLGQADLISVARGFMADPDWGLKAASGQQNSIRHCIGCMGCMDNLFSKGEVICSINALCGHEDLEFAEEARNTRKERILIVGAGPAGLEAAVRAASRGYSVIIIDKSSAIGGQWNIASAPPGKEEFLSLLDFYRHEIERLNVDLRLECPYSDELLNTIQPDRIIVATGARPFKPPIPAEEGSDVLTAWDVLQGQLPRGPEVVVIGGGATGCETAIYLAELGTIDPATLRFLMLFNAENPETLKQLLTRGVYKVKIVEMSENLASDMGKASRWPLLKHLGHLGIESYVNQKVREIRKNAVATEDTDNYEHWIKADSVVLATGSRPENSLFNQIKKRADRVYLLGDAIKPANVTEAIHGAYRLIADEFK